MFRADIPTKETNNSIAECGKAQRLVFSEHRKYNHFLSIAIQLFPCGKGEKIDTKDARNTKDGRCAGDNNRGARGKNEKPAVNR